MKSTFKNVCIAVLAAIVCCLWFYACREQQERMKANEKAKESERVLNDVIQPQRVYRDSSGAMHMVIVSKEKPYLASTTNERLVPFIDSVAKALDIKPKQVESTTVIATETQASQIAFLEKKIDSLKEQNYYYQDKYLQLVIRSGNPADTADKGAFDFKYNAQLAISQYWKRRKFLGIPIGVKQSFINISSDDPRATIMGVKKYTVAQKQPGWGLRLQAIQNYSFISNSANTGLRATFDLKHLSFTGGYYYNWQLQQWRPVVSVGYDIVRF